MMFMGPHFAGEADAGLYFVDHEHDFLVMADLLELLHELWTEVVVSTFSLYGFDDEGGDVVGVLFDGGVYFIDSLFFKVEEFFFVFFSEGEGYFWVGDTGPVEFGEVFDFIEVEGVGEGKGVAGASVESFFEVDDLVAKIFFGSAFIVFSDFPVKCGFETVFDSG